MDRLVSMRVFASVADEGGFAAAARALDISPPVVTRLIAELETHLGTRLFQRTTRRVSLTEAGQAYLDRVRHILQDIEEADAIASAHTQQLAGRLRVHSEPVLASYVIAPLLADFRMEHPGIIIDIEVGAPGESPVEDYDITLLGNDATLNPDNVARKVIESNAVLVAAPSYIERKGSPQSPQDLEHHDCLRLRRMDSPLKAWSMWRESDPAHIVEAQVKPIVMANHTDTLLRATLDGVGITSVALDMVAPYLMRGTLIRVLSPWITGRLTMYAALPSRKFIPQRSRVFLDFLVERTREQNKKALNACSHRQDFAYP